MRSGTFTDEFLDERIDAQPYQRSYFKLNANRVVLLEQERKIVQRGYGDANDYDDLLHLAHTINEEQLRECVSALSARPSRARRSRFVVVENPDITHWLVESSAASRSSALGIKLEPIGS